MQINARKLEVQHRPEAERFEIHAGGHTAVLDYRLDGNVIMFTHTGVPPALEGQGVGSRIVRAGLEYAREQGHQVVPACSFVAAYIRRHPEYQDLVE
ncbi:MAG: N-acetyltransferase [Chloroflexi bacterium]|nr:N-acetyltransferase [Chloroflexota bacterium]